MRNDPDTIDAQLRLSRRCRAIGEHGVEPPRRKVDQRPVHRKRHRMAFVDRSATSSRGPFHRRSHHRP
jgi:hypothetical protein